MLTLKLSEGRISIRSAGTYDRSDKMQAFRL